MSARVSILTCVSNGKGVGPGHTAIVIGSTVYSFENAGDWFSVRREKSGWRIFTLKNYLKANAHRPVILQQLTSRVDGDKALKYIKKSIASDADYLSSGVCSSQVSNAVDVAWNGSFNPEGIDTPWRVYTLANQKGIVTEITWTWSGKGTLSGFVRTHLEQRLRTEYKEIFERVASDWDAFV